MNERRDTYFIFQGLLMAVLLLLFIYEYNGMQDWDHRFFFLAAILGASLFGIKMTPKRFIDDWRFQMGLFLGDVGLASLTLRWSEPQSNLYFLYFIIIFGTGLTRSFLQSFIVGLTSSGLYLLSSWSPHYGFPLDTGFWLRVLFLWIATALLAIISKDIQTAQKDQESRFQQKLIHLESLASLGQLAGEVAHRIKGPLTTIMVDAEVLAKQHGISKDIQKELEEIQEAVRHCREILKSLLTLGRIEETDLRHFDLRDSVRSAIKSIEPQTHKREIQLQTQGLNSPLPVRGDPSLLHEAIAAILQNSIDAVGTGGRIQLCAAPLKRRLWWPTPGTLQDAFELTIEDDGKGIDPSDIQHIFQPFFSTKKEGSGLGLPAALRILQKHNGSIEAFSEGAGQGARFIVVIPKAPQRRKSSRR